MKRRNDKQHNRGALDLIEDATHLLRTEPMSLLPAYYLGTIPFALGLLFFVADMGSHPSAGRRVAAASLGLVVLFVWMKFWQWVFTQRALALLTGIQPAPVTGRMVLRVVASEVALQPFGLILIPIATVLTLPLAWVYSFFQNLTVLAGGAPLDFGRLTRRAARQCALWPVENQMLKLIMIGFGGFVFLNWLILGIAAPLLAKKLLGIETVFSRSPMAMANSTFFAVICMLTFLCMDPIAKVLHVLRCFHGEARTDGSDLKAALRREVLSGGKSIALIAAALLVFPVLGRAEEVHPARPASVAAQSGAVNVQSQNPDTVQPKELDRSIRETIAQRKYAWRMPRETSVSDEATTQEKGIFAAFMENIVEFVGKVLKGVLQLLDSLMRKIFGNWNPNIPSLDSGFGWMEFQRLLLYLLSFVVIAGLMFLGWRLWRHRRGRAREQVEASPLQAVPDLADENIGAEQLPEDGWAQLARECLARGEFRLALRAFYLSTLAHLASRQLITLARFKSNREYQDELQRRSHALADLIPLFKQSVGAFECVWYGTHPVSAESVAQFSDNVERIKALA
jgi:hypothetical protein